MTPAKLTAASAEPTSTIAVPAALPERETGSTFSVTKLPEVASKRKASPGFSVAP